MSLTPGPHTFSHERLRAVWRAGQHGGSNYYEQYRYFVHNEEHKLDQPRAARQVCLRLYESVQDPRNHLAELDARFALFYVSPFFRTGFSESAVSSYS